MYLRSAVSFPFGTAKLSEDAGLKFWGEVNLSHKITQYFQIQLQL